MLRALLYLVILIFLISFLRMVIGLILRTMGDMMRPQSTASTVPHGRPPSVSVSGELKRDPVCGTFDPASTAFRKTVNGEHFHFCSADCRDRYAG
jgi:YHS domain-containing protein